MLLDGCDVQDPVHQGARSSHLNMRAWSKLVVGTWSHLHMGARSEWVTTRYHGSGNHLRVRTRARVQNWDVFLVDMRHRKDSS